MSKPITKIDIDVLEEHLYLEGKQLYRQGKPNKSLNHQKMVRVGSERPYTSRVIFALQNGYSPIDYLLIDDDGDYVEVSDSIRQMFAYRKYPKINETEWSIKIKPLTGTETGYLARWFNLEGKRLSKTFKTSIEAEEYQKQMVKKVWGSELKRLNLYVSYFNP